MLIKSIQCTRALFSATTYDVLSYLSESAPPLRAHYQFTWMVNWWYRWGSRTSSARERVPIVIKQCSNQSRDAKLVAIVNTFEFVFRKIQFPVDCVSGWNVDKLMIAVPWVTRRRSVVFRCFNWVEIFGNGAFQLLYNARQGEVRADNTPFMTQRKIKRLCRTVYRGILSRYDFEMTVDSGYYRHMRSYLASCKYFRWRAKRLRHDMQSCPK